MPVINNANLWKHHEQLRNIKSSLVVINNLSGCGFNCLGLDYALAVEG
jgi:hypothetical protein